MKDLLIIDELSAARIELKNELKDFEINLIAVKSEIEAVTALYENKRIDVLLWVINSSNLLQLERIKVIARKNICQNVAIIVISKHADKRYILKAIEFGAKEFIVRPFDQDTLISKLSKFTKIEKKESKKIKILDDGGRIAYSIVDILNKEIKAAGRGSYKLSVMMIYLEKKYDELELDFDIDKVLEVYSKLIKSKLRDTDIVMQFQKSFLIMILPFADINGIQIVKNKIEKIFNSHTSLIKITEGYKISVVYVNYPEEGKTKDLLMEALEKKMKNLQLKI